MIGLIHKKYILILGLVAALCIVLWFWRSEIYKAAQNACAKAVSEKTIETTNQSKKDSDNVYRTIQTLDNAALDDRLCGLNIVRGNSGCDRD